jgi:hypothetical protein
LVHSNTKVNYALTVPADAVNGTSQKAGIILPYLDYAAGTVLCVVQMRLGQLQQSTLNGFNGFSIARMAVTGCPMATVCGVVALGFHDDCPSF